MKFSLLDRIIFRLTARRWNRLINLTLMRHYEKRTIDSAQMHTLAAEFDPTQDAAHKRIIGGELYNREWPRPA